MYEGSSKSYITIMMHGVIEVCAERLKLPSVARPLGKKLPRNWPHKGMFLCVPHGLFQINSQGSCYWHRTLHSRGENYVSVSERFACKCK